MTAEIIAFTPRRPAANVPALPSTRSPDGRVRLATLEEALAERQRLYLAFDKLVPNEDSPYTDEALRILMRIEEFPHRLEYVVDSEVHASYRAVRKAEVRALQAAADDELRRPA